VPGRTVAAARPGGAGLLKMPTKRRRAPGGASTRARVSARTLARRVAHLTAQLEALRRSHARRAAAIRRAADRRLAAMMREVAALRHHEARAEALARLLAERDAALAAQAGRIEELESLLHGSTLHR
jgi:hypothetical protein